LRGAAPWAARHAAKHAAEARARCGRAAAARKRPAPPSGRRRTPRTSSRRCGDLHGALSQIKTLRKNLGKSFYDIGLVLKDIQTRRLYEAKRFPSFESFVEREIDLGKDHVAPARAGRRALPQGRRARGRHGSAFAAIAAIDSAGEPEVARIPPAPVRRLRSRCGRRAAEGGSGGRGGATRASALAAAGHDHAVPASARSRCAPRRVLVDDLAHDRQAQPRPGLLGREERVEHLRERGGLDPRCPCRRPRGARVALDATRTRSVPPSFMASSAFMTRFRTTCFSFSGSPRSTQSLATSRSTSRYGRRGALLEVEDSSTSLPKCTSSRTAARGARARGTRSAGG
jgi:hypothetical protein